ncbi:enoyl-CoA hydratase/isomerase family protein [bacterium]|nr:MAG: enoyl-CoA hydratase/isomerase family protein [bacterium]
MDADCEFVRVEKAERLAVVTVDRPPVNAIHNQIRDELGRVFAEIDGALDIHAVVLTGGPRIFSAGVDIRGLRAAAPSDAVPRNTRYQAIFLSIARVRAPVIAAVNGYALGGGLELAMACDLRVAASDAFFALPEINLGGVPGAAGPQRLARLVGRGMATRMVVSGERVDAEEAYRIGLVDELAAPGEAIARAVELARRIAGHPPRAVQACKAAISLGDELPLERAQAIDRHLLGYAT